MTQWQCLPLLVDSTVVKLGMFGALVVSLSVHEFGHAWVADKLGDSTARSQGRLTLNPIPHLNPIFSVILPLGLLLSGTPMILGAGKPVPVQPNNLRRPALDLVWISLAGPFMNAVLALFFVAIYHGLVHWEGDVRNSLPQRLVWFSVGLNLALGVFNLIPVPPLDGHRLVTFFLPRRWAEQFERAWWLGLIVLVGLISMGGFAWLRKYVLSPLGELFSLLTPYGMNPLSG